MVVFFLSLLTFAAPSIDEIIANAQQSIHLTKHKTELILTVKKKRRTKEYQLSVYQDKEHGAACAEFHRPARDRGTKLLRKEEALWMYLPSIEKTKRIAGHMLNQGVMGSELSYEELLLQQDWKEAYKPEQHLDTIEQGIPCFHVTLHAKENTNHDAKRILWIEKEHFVPIKEQVYDSSGHLYREWIRKDLRQIDTQWIPFVQEIQNKRVLANQTIITIQNIDLTPNLSKDFFSHRWLER